MTEPLDLLIDGPDVADAILVLAHGSGAPMDSPFMEAIARGIARHGVRVVRFEFPYMARRRETGGKKPPDRAPVLRERWLSVVERLGDPASLIIGGKSLGGRIASTIADEVGARGLVCLGYPFHPAGKPDRLRVEHLLELSTPTLIVQGTRDALGSREEIRGYGLPSSIRVEYLEDGDHSFRPRVRSGRSEEEHLETAARLVAGFIDGLNSPYPDRRDRKR